LDDYDSDEDDAVARTLGHGDFEAAKKKCKYAAKKKSAPSDDMPMEATKKFCLALGEEKLHNIAADYSAKRKSKLSRIVEGGAAARKV